MTPEEHDALMLLREELGVPLTPGGVADLLLTRTTAILDAVETLSARLPASFPLGSALLTPAQVQQLTDAFTAAEAGLAAMARAVAALKGGT
jgi:hypothetical protein